jgi:hypothetical protein
MFWRQITTVKSFTVQVGGQGDQMIRKKLPNFSKIAQKVAKSKKAKISTTKLNLKTQNIYIKPLLKL